MEKICVEICCGSAEDVFAASRAGADRAELSSCLYFGGLTPSLGELTMAVKAGIPVMAMARCRQGGFCYTESERRIMEWDAAFMGQSGAGGVVFGGLTDEGKIDRDFCRRMVSAANGLQTVFHRAFDLIKGDWRPEVEFLINAGVTRILTSGFEQTAARGAENIAAMAEFAGGAIEILPAAGIREDNLWQICRLTGQRWVHSSAGRLAVGGGEGLFNARVSFAPNQLPQGPSALSEQAARRLVERAAAI